MKKNCRLIEKLLLSTVCLLGLPALAQNDEAAQAAALNAAQGTSGGTVSVMAVWGGAEQEAFLAALAPFEEATGIRVEYEGTRDINAVLTTRVQGGNPPDIAGIPSVGLLQEWAEQNHLLDLGEVVGEATLMENFAPGWLELGSYEGKTYGLFFTASLKGLVWYNTKTYQGPTAPASWEVLLAWSKSTAQTGTAPWCLGVENGAFSGWPATDWIENLFLRQSGPETYDAWWQGELPWTSPEVRSAFEAFGEIATDPAMVYGGPVTALATNFADAGTPLFTDPPGCFLMHQASFIATFFGRNTPGTEAVTDYNFFAFPTIDPEFEGAVEAAGDMFGVFNDTPQARALIRYLATPEAQAIWPSVGNQLSPHQKVPLGTYQNPLARSTAEILTQAEIVRFDASDIMPGEMGLAFIKSTLDYIQNPSRLNAILEELERVRQESY